MAERTEIRPQPGPQSAFLSCSADIAIYGGAAGGGKTYALLLDPLRGIHLPGFACVFFRRELTQITAAGGVWDEAQELYGALEAKLRSSPHAEARWPTGSVIQFRHLQHETDKTAWQGAQIPCILFDELTHFNASQFWYLTSRNRSTCGVKPWIRATCNPDSDSWVRQLIDWWIGEDGYPVPSRSGVIRWFIRRDNELVWFDSRAEAKEHCCESEDPRSLTFIAASLEDNAILREKDPGYRATLEALPRVEREQLLGGNWNASYVEGLYQSARWTHCRLKDIERGLAWVRSWDLASTAPSPQNPDPDWTAGVLVARNVDRDGVDRVYLRDGRFVRRSAAGVEELMSGVATQDGRRIPVVVEEEPGSAGKNNTSHYQRNVLPRHEVRPHRPTGDKASRQKPLIAAAERGEIVFVDEDPDADWIVQAQRWARSYNPDNGSKKDFWDAAAQGFFEAPVTKSVDTRRKSCHRSTGGKVRPARLI